MPRRRRNTKEFDRGRDKAAAAYAMQELYRLIDQDPRFRALQRSRSRFAWALTGVALTAYYAFILTTAFAPEVFARALHPSTVVTVGLLGAVSVIILSIGLTGIYIARANREFDRINRAIVDDATRRAASRQ